MNELKELEQKYNSLLELYEKELADHRKLITAWALKHNKPETGKAKLEAEEVLMESKANLDAIFNATNESIFLIAADNTLLAMNEIAAKRMGGTRKEWIGRSVLDLLPPEIAAHRRPFIDQVLLTKKPVDFSDLRNERWMDSRIYPILDEQGQVSRMAIFSRDITEHKQAGEKLIMITKAVDSAGDAIGISDAKGHHFYQNRALSELFGYANAAELDAAGGGQVVIKDPQVARQLYESIMSGKSWMGELEMVTKSGRVFPAYERADAIRDHAGNIIGLIGIISDMSERKHAEDSLRLFRDMVQNSSDAIGMSSPDGQHYYQNEAFVSLFGDIKNHSPLILFVDQGIGNKVFDTILNGGTWQGEVNMFKHDRTILTILLRAYAIKDREGRILGLVGIHSDITERKQAEILQDAIYRIARTTDQTEDLDSLYGSIHKIIQDVMPANNFYLALYDEENDLISFPYCVDELDPPFPPQKPGKGLTEYVFRTGKSLLCDEALEEELHRRGLVELVGAGSPIWLGAPLLIEGKTVGVMVVQDYKDAAIYGEREQHILEYVSSQVAIAIHRKQAEQAIHQLNETLEERVEERTRQLEAINKELEFHIKEIEQFIFIASHDLQEPLLTLTNHTNLIHEEYAGKLDEDGNKSINFIYHSATRMKLLLKGLLDYSLLGKESVRSVVDCNKVLGEVLTDLAATVDKNCASVIVNDLPVLHGYPSELRLLFQNLVDNAIKFHKPEAYPEIEISAENHLKEWVFSIKDNGIGIKERDRERIFIIFKRMVNQSAYKGTGIGLAHCKKIVEMHGGRIWVESNPGGGSTFRFTIPC